MTRHFLTDLDLTSEEQSNLIHTAIDMKKQPKAYQTKLAGKVLGMIFMKQSTRTRVSFEVGMIQLGGQAIFLSPQNIQIGRGETIEDTARVLSRYVDAIMIRTFAHEEIRTLAEYSRVPVINGLDDVYHPCQMLADLMTIQEKQGKIAGQQLVYIGDGNNVSHSLMLSGAVAGMHVRVIAPKGYQPNPKIVELAQKTATSRKSRIEVTADVQAIEGADIVCTDTWTSMGQEKEAEKRRKDLAGYQVDAKLMKRAKPSAIFMHCLPAHRGEEVTEDVIDGKQSVIFDEAENRLHAQKALLTFLLGAK